jgi:hypothetical protein
MIGNQVTSKSGHSKPGFMLTQCFPFNFLCAQIGQHHPHNSRHFGQVFPVPKERRK